MKREKKKNELLQDSSKLKKMIKLKNKIPERTKEIFKYNLKWHRLFEVSLF